jgi:hypothetical protein
MTTMTISKELLDELLSGVERPEDLLGDKGLMKELKVRLMERMLGAELTEHLGYEPHGEPDSQQTNRRNGASRAPSRQEAGNRTWPERTGLGRPTATREAAIFRNDTGRVRTGLR